MKSSELQKGGIYRVTAPDECNGCIVGLVDGSWYPCKTLVDKGIFPAYVPPSGLWLKPTYKCSFDWGPTHICPHKDRRGGYDYCCTFPNPVADAMEFEETTMPPGDGFIV